MQDAHRCEARRLAETVKAALKGGAPAANFVVRCYRHERAAVEAGVWAELRRALAPDDLPRVRVVMVEFEAIMPEPDIRVKWPDAHPPIN